MRSGGPAKSANRQSGKAESLRAVEPSTRPVLWWLVFVGVFFFGYFLLDKQKKVTAAPEDFPVRPMDQFLDQKNDYSKTSE
jgi:hypothetical protein